MLYDVDSNTLRFPTWRISDSKLYKYVQFKKIPGLDFHDDWKLVIPRNKRKDILLKCHDDLQAGHPGVFKTFKRVFEHFYWPEMKADISSYVKRCKVCCENKPEQRKPAGLLTLHRVVDGPFQLVCCDLIGPLPRSNRGLKFIVVMVDNFSKFSLVISLRNSTAKEFPMNLEIGVPDSSGDFTVDQEISARDRSKPSQQLYKEVKGELLKAAERNKRYYDLRHRDVKYEVGDEVYRENFVQSDAAKFYFSKLANKFVGPFIVS
ncbi:hypothetical protein JTB14_032621 [Gonioctena quinquepunctata]|nr:hypothetical protein JTB14_032621 [Gonioctena quinquepunctata]